MIMTGLECFLFDNVLVYIWRRRNLRVFEERVLSNDALKLQVAATAETLMKVQQRLAGTNLNGHHVLDR